VVQADSELWTDRDRKRVREIVLGEARDGTGPTHV
jgi:hypothetical protein